MQGSEVIDSLKAGGPGGLVHARALHPSWVRPGSWRRRSARLGRIEARCLARYCPASTQYPRSCVERAPERYCNSCHPGRAAGDLDRPDFDLFRDHREFALQRTAGFPTVGTWSRIAQHRWAVAGHSLDRRSQVELNPGSYAIGRRDVHGSLSPTSPLSAYIGSGNVGGTAEIAL